MSPIGMRLAPGKGATAISAGSRTSRMKTRSPRSRRALSAVGSIAPISGIRRQGRAPRYFSPIDVVGKQLDLREHRQLAARNRKTERVALTRPNRIEMRLLVQDFLHIRIVRQAFGMMVVEAFTVKDFTVAVLEREVQADIVYRPVADIGDFAPDHQVWRQATRTLNQVGSDHRLELVVGHDLGLRMSVGEEHVRFRACQIAVLGLDGSGGKDRADRTEGQKSRDCD